VDGGSAAGRQRRQPDAAGGARVSLRGHLQGFVVIRRPLIGMLLVAIPLALASRADATPSPDAANNAAWRAWDALTHRACPAHHVDWLYGATYPYLYGGFNSSLPIRARRRLESIASIDRSCADETIGHSCELGNYIRSYRAEGLLLSFVRYSCRHVRCEEAAECSRAPGQ
jgi:hypothetical protein